MDLGRLLLAGAAFAIIAYVVHTAGAFATMGYYTDPAYFPVWSPVMMPGPGGPPLSFTGYSLLFNGIAGVFFAFVYKVLKDAVPGKSPAQKGATYGALVFLVAGVPSFFAMVLLINLPSPLLLAWAVENLAVWLLAGVATAKAMR